MRVKPDELEPPRVGVKPRDGLLVFVAIAFGLAWLIWLPLWIDPRHLAAPWARWLMAAGMLAPACGTLAATRVVERPADIVAATGLRLRPAATVLPWIAAAWVVTPLLVLGALALGAALGVAPLDFRGAPGLRHALEASPAGVRALAKLSAGRLLAVQVAAACVIGPLVNAPVVFGEEWGWRGYLVPRLARHGHATALIGSGVVWGLWHAPLIVLGHNYPGHPFVGPLMMVAFCVAVGSVLGHLRLVSGSVWPAVVAHGSLNALGPVVLAVIPDGSTWNPLTTGISGLVGLALLAPLAAWALTRGSTRQGHAPAA